MGEPKKALLIKKEKKKSKSNRPKLLITTNKLC